MGYQRRVHGECQFPNCCFSFAENFRHRVQVPGAEEEVFCGGHVDCGLPFAMSIPTNVLTHAQRVCRLYKKACRNLEYDCYKKAYYRYAAVLMRQRFEETRSE